MSSTFTICKHYVEGGTMQFDLRLRVNRVLSEAQSLCVLVMENLSSTGSIIS